MLTEKYRPKTLDEVIGQDEIVKTLKEFIKRKDIPHMLFVGPAGVGKTSTAYAFAHDLGVGIYELNASDERGIETVRTKIKTVSRTVGKRVILLDEVDSMTPDAQHALRRIIETAAKGTIFILTCNYEWKIIDPIKSRTAIFYFNKLNEKQILRILLTILKKENIKIELTEELKQSLFELIRYTNGDARKAINMLETMISSNREITPGNIRLMINPTEVRAALEYALNGDIISAIRKIEDIYITAGFNSESVIESLYKTIKTLNVDDFVKTRLYVRLSEVERNIKIGCSPLIQLTALVSEAWLAATTAK